MAEFEQVATVDEVQPGGRLPVVVDDVPVLLIRTGDEFYAIEDVCPHDGQPLTDGSITDGTIMCPRHGAKFDVKTGDVLCMPATEPVASFEVEIRDGAVFLRPRVNDSTDSTTAVTPTPAESAPVTTAIEESAGSADGDSLPASMPEGTVLIDALKQVIDPELMINIVDLGLIYNVESEESQVNVDMTLTSPACPAGPQIVQQAKMALERLDGVTEASIRLTMTPPWTPERMTDDARDQLGIF